MIPIIQNTPFKSLLQNLNLKVVAFQTHNNNKSKTDQNSPYDQKGLPQMFLNHSISWMRSLEKGSRTRNESIK